MWCKIVYVLFGLILFFFKQKTAYEMRISDWSSDVCSSDLSGQRTPRSAPRPGSWTSRPRCSAVRVRRSFSTAAAWTPNSSTSTWKRLDRKSVVQGKSVTERVDLGGRRILKTKKHSTKNIIIHNKA